MNGVATASMDMGDFFYYTLPKGSWLYFSGALQVAALYPTHCAKARYRRCHSDASSRVGRLRHDC